VKNFDRVADIYDATREMPAFVFDRLVDRVIAATSATSETRFLEIGVGTGRIAMPFLERGYRFTGVDISERMMDRLREKVGERDMPLTLVQADITELPFEDATFDVVLGVHILHLVSDWKKAVREARRVLAPTGYLVLGYENSLLGSDSPAVADPAIELRHQWQALVRQAGISLSSRSGNWAAIQLELIEGGSYAAVYRVAQWETPVAPRTVLEEQRNRVYSHTWEVPDDVLAAVHGRMVEWATERYGSLDVELTSEQEFLLAVHRFPSESR